MPIGTSDGKTYDDEFHYALENLSSKASTSPIISSYSGNEYVQQNFPMAGEKRTSSELADKKQYMESSAVVPPLSTNVIDRQAPIYNRQFYRTGVDPINELVQRDKDEKNPKRQIINSPYQFADTQNLREGPGPGEDRRIVSQDEAFAHVMKNIGETLQKSGFKLPDENSPTSKNIEDKREPSLGEWLAYAFTNHSSKQLKEMLSHPFSRYVDPQAKAYDAKIRGPTFPAEASSPLAKSAGYEDINPEK